MRSLAFLLLGICLAFQSALAEAIVLVDDASHLVVELRIPKAKAIPVEGGTRFIASGFPNLNQPGQPDLPAWRFQVVANATPEIQLEILESELISDRNPVAPVLTWVTPNQGKSEKNASAFARARTTAIQMESPSSLRGIALRSGVLPLGWVDQDGKMVGCLKRVKVTMTWPANKGGSSALPPIIASQVLNPKGGAFLWSPVRAPLAKRGARSLVLSSHLVKIHIGDRELDQFDEDGFYALPFSTLAAQGLALPGVKMASLRMVTGPNDTILTRMDTLGAVASRLREVPLEIVDSRKDGIFDEGDTLKFYAHGTSLWKRADTGSSRIRYVFGTDPYSFDNYYYLDWGNESNAGSETSSPARIGTVPKIAAINPVQSGWTYLRAEQDLGTAFCDPSPRLDTDPGYEWHWAWRGKCNDGDNDPIEFYSKFINRPHIPNLPGYAGDSVYMGVFLFRSTGEDLFDVSVKGLPNRLSYLAWPTVAGAWYTTDGPVLNGRFELEKLVWRGSDKRFEGYTVVYRRKYQFTGENFWIFPETPGKRSNYQITGSQTYRVLKVEDGIGAKWIEPAPDGSFSDSIPSESDARYLVMATEKQVLKDDLEAENAPTPGTAMLDLATSGKSLNGSGGLPEMLIISPSSLLPAALEYRDYRASNKRAMPLRAEVVQVSDIYRQFSGGRVTPIAIRDFLWNALENWDPQGRAHNPLRFVLLLGDGHYDLRRIKPEANSPSFPNLIPPFENFDSPGDAICSDDFFVKLDPEDQGFFRSSSESHALIDIAIGRVPVRSLEEARQYLDKVKAFEDPTLGGDWRSHVILTADDQIQRGQANDLDPIRFGHTNDTERLGETIQGLEPGVQLDKVYLLDYAINAAGRKPESAQDLLDLINRGALAVNFVGHGAFNQWADEVLISTNEALPKLRNSGRTTLLNSFSCTVGRFDNMQSDVLTEQFVRQKDVGAIAGIASSRESYPGPNLDLAGALYRRIFSRDSAQKLMPIGVALMEAKNSNETSNDFNDAKYSLLGDPALLFRRPNLKVSLASYPDTLKALDCGQIKGTITGGTQEGLVHIQIVSGTIRKDYTNLGQGMTDQYQNKRGNILYERTAPYTNGRFAADYFIPKKIPYGDSTAQIRLYAWDGTKEFEGSTAVQNLRIEGTAVGSACAVDTERKGPRIHISGCDPTETGSVDFPEGIRITLPYCFSIQVEDSSGGVVSGDGPDEGTTVEIPGVVDPFHPQPGVDNLYSKSYRYSLTKTELRPGSYQLKVGAHDGFGNSSQRSLKVEVVQDTVNTAVGAFNTPNPMRGNGTTFRFASIMPADDGEYLPTAGTRIQYDIKIYNQLGRMVQLLSNANAEGTPWNGTDAFGNRLANGVYSYVVHATFDPRDGSGKRFKSSKRNALVISR